MGKNDVLCALAMVVVVVGVDLLFFRDKTWSWERLAANVGIVLLFGALYFSFPRSFMSGEGIAASEYGWVLVRGVHRLVVGGRYVPVRLVRWSDSSGAPGS